MSRMAELSKAAALAIALVALPAAAEPPAQSTEAKQEPQKQVQATAQVEQVQRADNAKSDSKAPVKMTREEQKAETARIRKPPTREEEAWMRQAYPGG